MRSSNNNNNNKTLHQETGTAAAAAASSSSSLKQPPPAPSSLSSLSSVPLVVSSTASSSRRPRRKRTRYAVPRQKNPFLSRTLGKPIQLEGELSLPTTFEIFSMKPNRPDEDNEDDDDDGDGDNDNDMSPPALHSSSRDVEVVTSGGDVITSTTTPGRTTRHTKKPININNTTINNSINNTTINNINNKKPINMVCRIETRGDQKCPFCSFPAGTAKRLFKHCRRFHGDHHCFTSVKAEDGALYIHAKPVHLADAGATLASPRNYQFFRFRSKRRKHNVRNNNSNKGMAHHHHYHHRRPCPRIKVKPYTMDVVGNSIETLLNKEQQKQQQLTQHNNNNNNNNNDDDPASSSRPKRQYYHSRSRLPMQPGEWAVDSDDESDTTDWLDELGQAGLNEFVDITEQEKRFLDMWKRFIRSDSVVVDEKIPSKVMIFIQEHVRELKGLRKQLLMHLMVLWEHKLMPSEHILTCMEAYDAVYPLAPSAAVAANTTTTTTTMSPSSSNNNKNNNKEVSPTTTTTTTTV